MQSILFKNWTTKEFVGKWDGVPYTFAPGQAMYLEDWKAEHFAKHLTDAVMQAEGKEVNHFTRPSYLEKCFVKSIDVNPKNAESEILNKNIEEDKVEAPAKKKGGRPVKAMAEVVEVVEDASFEGLK